MSAKMTVASVRAEVRRIRKMADDHEAAHGAEDGLRHKVLKAIADGVENPAELAAAALETTKIGIARWCA